MPRALITTQDEFEQLCAAARDAGRAVFDTEFVSEFSYHPELCLLQFNIAGECSAVDPYELDDLSSWWEVMADDSTEIIVHGGQAEVRFCHRAIGRAPQKLVDMQLAEGFRSTSYPLGYSSLVQRVARERVGNRETRTDWRKRPLSRKQLTYALDDVRFGEKIWNTQRADLDARGRLEWAHSEFDRFVRGLIDEEANGPWQRLPGIQKLSRRELAVARELAGWREEEAARRNKPPRKILRDDLIVDLARHQPRTRSDVLAARDMNRQNYRQVVDDLLEAIERGLAIPEEDLPRLKKPPRTEDGGESVLAKLLALALNQRCNELDIAQQLVGTNADLLKLIVWHVRKRASDPPRIATGWRAEVCGDLLTDLLDGKISVRVRNAKSPAPLVFEAE